MRRIILDRIGTFEDWRGNARALLSEGVPPESVVWSRGLPETEDLFATPSQPKATSPVSVSKGFLDLANHVIWHRDPERFARLYALLWDITRNGRPLSDPGNPDIARLQSMAKEVRRDKHKMTAFVRFREIGEPSARRRSFAAWFEPTNYIVEPSAPFFEKRFGDMDWTIFTPDLTAAFESGKTTFRDGIDRPPLPDDATEELWRTYFRNIFNPARLMVKAMQAEMPKKYWKNLPEADLIPGMIAGAEARARAMAEAAPTLPPERAGRITERLAAAQARAPAPPGTHAALNEALTSCRHCPLWKTATQPVPGEGPTDARLMVVGEQPGDTEDLTGRPFVGPSGQLFDHAAAAAGLDRSESYVTNAVKHFKFSPRGKRRIHQTPSTSEVHHCRWWLDAERALVRPDLIIAMGATALESLTGDRTGLLKRRGGIEMTRDGTPVFVTIHPSYILRLPEPEQAAELRRFIGDLESALAALEKQTRGDRTKPNASQGLRPAPSSW